MRTTSPRLPVGYRRRPFSQELGRTAGEVRTGTASGQDAPDRLRAVCRTEPERKRGRQAGDLRLPWLHAYQREERNGSYAVRRMTIRKRMRKKLQEIKQQLRMRMHDPVPQTGAWLRSVIQGYFNYYAVPGNLESLGLFRERVLRYSGLALKRRSQRHRYAWVRHLKLAAQWLPTLRVMHPWPLDRFAATHPR